LILAWPFWSQRLKLKYDDPISNFAFNSNYLRPYMTVFLVLSDLMAIRFFFQVTTEGSWQGGY
jgi:hypothetical protein